MVSIEKLLNIIKYEISMPYSLKDRPKKSTNPLNILDSTFALSDKNRK